MISRRRLSPVFSPPHHPRGCNNVFIRACCVIVTLASVIGNMHAHRRRENQVCSQRKGPAARCARPTQRPSGRFLRDASRLRVSSAAPASAGLGGLQQLSLIMGCPPSFLLFPLVRCGGGKADHGARLGGLWAATLLRFHVHASAEQVFFLFDPGQEQHQTCADVDGTLVSSSRLIQMFPLHKPLAGSKTQLEPPPPVSPGGGAKACRDVEECS